MDQLLQNVYDTVRHDFTDPSPADYQFGVGGVPAAMDKGLVNCFTISAQSAGGVEKYIHKRSAVTRILGMDLATTLGAVNSTAVANAVMTSLNDVYVAAFYDATNSRHVIIQYRPITGTQVSVGTIAGTGISDDIFLTELTIANVCTLGVVWNKSDGTTSKGYFATSGAAGFAAASLTEIVDVDFPPKRGTPLPLVGPMVQMNGTTYVMTNTGEIANSDLNSITSWNTLGTIQAIQYPDQGVALVRYKHHLIAFGEDSIEFFNDVGQPPPKSPLARTEQAFIKFGAFSPRAVIAVDDTVYWLAKSGSGTMGLYRLDGYAPVKVSTPAVDYAIGRSIGGFYPTANVGCLTAFTMMGTKHIMLGGCNYVPSLANLQASPTMNKGQLVFNVTEGEYWTFEANQGSREETLLAVSQYQLNNSNPDFQYVFIADATGSAPIPGSTRNTFVHQIAQNANLTFQDRYGSGSLTNYNMIVQSNKLWWGTEKRKRIHRLKAILDTEGNGWGVLDSGSITFAWVKGIYDTNNNVVVTSRSTTFPNTAQRYYVANLGQARTWQFLLTMVFAGPLRLRALEFDMSQAAS